MDKIVTDIIRQDNSENTKHTITSHLYAFLCEKIIISHEMFLLPVH